MSPRHFRISEATHLIHPAFVNLLTFHLHEPLPGLVLPEMTAEISPEEAARRYRAIVLTTLNQMKGLANTRIRLKITPDDAGEAVRFWLLPRLADRWQSEAETFRSEGWEIDFSRESGDFEIHAYAEILCPDLSARWVHTGLLGFGRTISRVRGLAPDGEEYFLAETAGNFPERLLPALPVIRSDADWQTALDSPIGAALKKAWEQEI
ncbi:MAG: hypothetical protein QM627_00360 [Luteolibacter sp.]